MDKSRKIVIIGASSGIGRALAAIYAQRGNQVGITGRRRDLLESLAAEYPGKMHVSCFDASAPDAIARVKALVDELGGMDLLIFNAGYGEPSKDLDPAIEQATTDINVNAFLRITNYAFTYFVERGSGQLATVSSIASVRGNDYAPAYSAGKAFQSIYFEGLTMKVRKNKLPIYLTDVQPGFVDTKMAKSTKLFWVAPVGKAARQIVAAIDRKKPRVYITRRWRLIAWLLKWIPDFLYYRFR